MGLVISYHERNNEVLCPLVYVFDADIVPTHLGGSVWQRQELVDPDFGNGRDAVVGGRPVDQQTGRFQDK